MDTVLFLLFSSCLLSLSCGQKITAFRFLAGSMSGTTNSGTIEVYNSVLKEWGTVCSIGTTQNQKFGAKEAQVICAMMGFDPFTASDAIFNRPKGTGKIMIAQLNCKMPDVKNSRTWDAETQCTYSGWVQGLGSSCNSHDQDAGVWCGPATSPRPQSTVAPNLQTLPPISCANNQFVRLVPGPNKGRVEIRQGINAAWGTVCAGTSSSFGQNEAMAICATLCKKSTVATPLPSSAVLPPATGTGVAINNLVCPFNATDFNACMHDGWNNAGSICNAASMSVGVVCELEVITPAPPPTATVVCSNYRAKAYFKRSNSLYESLLSLEKPFVNATCDFSRSQNTTHVWVDFPVIGCNETQSSTSTHVVYTTYVHKSVDLNSANVSVDSPYSIPIACAMPKIDQVTASPIGPEVLSMAPQVGSQQFTVSLQLYGARDAKGGFIEELKMPARIKVGKQVHAVLDLVGGGAKVRLVVLQCTAMPTRGSSTKLKLISNKCGVDYCDASVPRSDPKYCTQPGNYRITATPLSNNRFWFHFPAFKWNTQDASSQIFIDCQVYTCGTQNADQTCSATCGTPMPTISRRKRRSAQHSFRWPFSHSLSRSRRSVSGGASLKMPISAQESQPLSDGPLIVEGEAIGVLDTLKSPFVQSSAVVVASASSPLLLLSVTTWLASLV